MKQIVAIVVVAGCAAAAPVAEPRPGIDVRIVPHDELITRTTSQQPIALPFGQRQNGTQLVVALLQRARDAGASYVGDVAFHMVFKWRGALVECETKLRFGDAPAPAPPPVPDRGSDDDAYSTEVQSFEPHEIAFVANERDLACKQVAVTRETQQRRYASRFDGEVARKSDDIPVDTVMVSENVEQCVPQEVERDAIRYDYQMRLEYVPPDWHYLGATYAGGVVSESPPLCYAIDASSLGAQPTHRLTATLGFRGQVEQLEPLEAPSRGPIKHH